MKRKRNISTIKIDRITSQFFFLCEPFKELWYGFSQGKIPLFWCSLWGVTSSITLTYQLDIYLFKISGYPFLYPYQAILYWTWYFTCTTLVFWLWAWRQVYLKHKLTKRLTEIFLSADLKNSLGQLPSFISNSAIDGETQKLVLKKANLHLYILLLPANIKTCCNLNCRFCSELSFIFGATGFSFCFS